MEKITMDSLPSWDLSDLYTSIEDPKITADLNQLDRQIELFEKDYQGKISQLSPLQVRKAIESYENIQALQAKLLAYGYLIRSVNLKEEKVTNFYTSISEKVQALASKIIFFTLELNNLQKESFNLLLHDKALDTYRPWLKEIRKFQPYQLSQELEQYMTDQESSSWGAWIQLYDKRLAELVFKVDDKPLSLEEALLFSSDPEEEVRRKAYISLSEVFKVEAPLFSHIYNALLKTVVVERKWRGLKHEVQSRNIENNIPDEVVDIMADTVKSCYERIPHRYFKLKAQWLGKEALALWDRSAPFPGEKDTRMSWANAKELVLKAYHRFSPRMAEIGELFFDQQWIDAAPLPGKDSGAYCYSLPPEFHPYILVNYHGKRRDIMTLAHELGHGIHDYLTQKQPFLLMRTSLALAETASVFGEMLVFRFLLETTEDPEARRILIAHKVEEMIGTVFRQVSFFEFERQVHQERKNGPLSTQKMAEIWSNTQQACYGEAVTLDDTYHNFWLYISHFYHVPFYVYAYAFGDCFVNALYGVYQDNPTGFQEKYLHMLESGNNLSFQEHLAAFGFDGTDRNFWLKGLHVIEDLIEELEHL